MTDDVTIGEVYRKLTDIDERHSAQLKSIDDQARLTNGRMTRAEARLDGHDVEFKDLKQARRPASHELKRSTDRSDAITLNIPINAKTIMALLAAAITIAMAGWKAGLF
jgi:hypothetical protein